MARAWCRRLHPDQWMVRAGLPRGSHSSRHSNRLTSGTVSGMSSPTNLSPFTVATGGIGPDYRQKGMGQHGQGDVPAPADRIWRT